MTVAFIQSSWICEAFDCVEKCEKKKPAAQPMLAADTHLWLRPAARTPADSREEQLVRQRRGELGAHVSRLDAHQSGTCFTVAVKRGQGHMAASHKQKMRTLVRAEIQMSTCFTSHFTPACKEKNSMSWNAAPLFDRPSVGSQL